MQFQDSPYIFPLIISSLINASVAFYAWQRRFTGGRALALLALACAEWSLGYALEIAGADLPTKILWGKSQYIGIVSVPPLWIIFSYSYLTKGTQITRRNVSLLFIVPLITLILAFTTELHGLIWKDIRIRTIGTFSALEVTHGLLFWIYWIYSNILLLAGTIFILRSFDQEQGLFRRQNIIMLIAVLTPWFGNVLYISGLSPIPTLDITPFAFTISIVLFAWGILNFKLVNLAPVARELYVEKMSDGMMVLDAEGIIIDTNPALLKLLGISPVQAIGQRAKDVLSAWPFWVERYENVQDAHDEIFIGEGKSRVWYELLISALLDSRDNFLGRVVTVRNITEKKETEDALRHSKFALNEKLPLAPSALRVFLCHSSSDKQVVRKLYQRLKFDNFDPWLDKEKLLPGADWDLEIRKAVRESDVVVVCLSKHFNEAGYRQKEVRIALDTASEKPEGTIFLIPLKLEECEVPERLRRWHWVNYFERNGYKKLLDALNARAGAR